MLQIAICDDETSQRTKLKSILTPWLELKNLPFSLHDFSSGADLCNAYRKTKFDLIFLDIEMPELNGVETAKALRQMDTYGKLIFITAYPDYVFQGYEVHAFHYILKPYQENKLLQVTENALNDLQKETQDFFLLPNGSGSIRLRLQNVLYFYSDKRQIIAVTTEDIPQKTLTFYGKLDDLQKQLPEYFCRIHQRYLINLRQIQKTDEANVWIEGEKLPLSRAHKQSFLIAFAKSMLRKG